MRSRRLSKCGGWTVGLLAVLLWWAVPASEGSVPALSPVQQSSQQGSGSQQCSTGQQNQTQQGANGSSSKNTNGTKNGCGSAQPAKKPAPLFGGSLSIKRSTQSTDTAALGFNGVDSNGQVQQALLNAAPSAASVQQVQAMANSRPSAADLAAFQREGDLVSTSAPVKPGQGK